jgi:dTDP-glucose pyrophosphorylase
MVVWREITLRKDHSIRVALENIDRAGTQIALVVDDQMRLLGTVTDGDVRRAILNGVDLSSPISQIMNPSPKTVLFDTPIPTVTRFMTANGLKQLPIVTASGAVCGLHSILELLKQPRYSNRVVIMAGGYGTRLRPLTDSCPKPLLPVGGKPILELIIESLSAQGFSNITITTHYKAEMIEQYFQDGSHWKVNIDYIKEVLPLGTAGALSMLPKTIDSPIIVLNGDLLSNVSFEALLEFHNSKQCDSTMAVKDYDIQIPYGVVHHDGITVEGIAEKPKHRFSVNAGIYVINPVCLDFVPSDTPSTMVDLLNKLLKNKKSCCSFPIADYWLDVGQPEEFQQANRDVHEVLA